MSANAPHDGCFELVFRPSADLVSVVRHFVSDFYNNVLADADTASRLALATHELVENSVKYSSTQETRLSIEVTGHSEKKSVCVRSRNRAAAGHRARLASAFSEMQQSTDAFAFYQVLMRRTAGRPGSGLGLARIMSEADMLLSLEILDDVVVITARCAVGAAEGQDQ